MQLHLAKLAREGIERGRAEDLKQITRQASEREEKLRAAMEDAEDKHGELSAASDVEMALVVMLVASSGVTLPSPGGTGVLLHATDSEMDFTVMLVTSS